MLSSTENYLFPVLVEQMTYRTQLEKNEYPCNSWTFNDVLVRLLDIIAYPIKIEIENNTGRLGYTTTSGSSIHPKLIDSCCHLLARVLSEVIFESNSSEVRIPIKISYVLYKIINFHNFLRFSLV